MQIVARFVSLVGQTEDFADSPIIRGSPEVADFAAHHGCKRALTWRAAQQFFGCSAGLRPCGMHCTARHNHRPRSSARRVERICAFIADSGRSQWARWYRSARVDSGWPARSNGWPARSAFPLGIRPHPTGRWSGRGKPNTTSATLSAACLRDLRVTGGDKRARGCTAPRTGRSTTQIRRMILPSGSPAAINRNIQCAACSPADRQDRENERIIPHLRRPSA